MKNDINFTDVDTLGSLLAQIADLTKQADAIKDAIKEQGSLGQLPVRADSKGKKIQYLEGAIFSATYVESNRSVFDKDAFVAEYGEAVYAKFTKVSASYAVKVTSK